MTSTAIEAAASVFGASVLLLGLIWRPLMDRHDKKEADEVLLHGSKPLPGIAAIAPLGERLHHVETTLEALSQQVQLASGKIDDISGQLEVIIKEFKPNGGNSMRDRIDSLGEQFPSSKVSEGTSRKAVENDNRNTSRQAVSNTTTRKRRLPQ